VLGMPDSGMRKSHRKSRKGCHECKRRRVKVSAYREFWYGIVH
jgi:hypothetical protein